MTLLMSWIGVDSRGPASIYLASDSRISWDNGSTWDYARKLFASRKHPVILGYCGDVLFPSQVLGQLIDLVDWDLLFREEDTTDKKWLRILAVLQRSFADYPGSISRPFSILYCTREGSRMHSVFRLRELSWEDGVGWNDEGWIDLPKESGPVAVLGSGREAFGKCHSSWSRSGLGRTSRIAFSAFCDALGSGEDDRSGGAPQLVGLYRERAAESLGIVYQNERFLFGLPTEASGNLNAVEWRNCLFERCDWRTVKPLVGAQRHARPCEVSTV